MVIGNLRSLLAFALLLSKRERTSSNDEEVVSLFDVLLAINVANFGGGDTLRTDDIRSPICSRFSGSFLAWKKRGFREIKEFENQGDKAREKERKQKSWI